MEGILHFVYLNHQNLHKTDPFSQYVQAKSSFPPGEGRLAAPLESACLLP